MAAFIMYINIVSIFLKNVAKLIKSFFVTCMRGTGPGKENESERERRGFLSLHD
jgi:hypothetical protein